ncbi:MAG: hypothetical protein M0Z69_14850 [Actinomycetota bacterium]|nr:hypothetical protein [Actinomycetota bacterium]
METPAGRGRFAPRAWRDRIRRRFGDAVRLRACPRRLPPPGEPGGLTETLGLTPPAAADSGGLVLWVTIAIILGSKARWWELDLRVHRGAGQLLLAGRDPHLLHYTRHRLPFIYPPFSLLAPSPLSALAWPLEATLWGPPCPACSSECRTSGHGS